MKDQVMIVTGAAMGLGLAAAKVLAARGAAGALVDYNADALKTAQAELSRELSPDRVETAAAVMEPLIRDPRLKILFFKRPLVRDLVDADRQAASR